MPSGVEAAKSAPFDRDAAWALLCEFTESKSLRKHALAVEGVMRAFAGRAGEDEGAWGIVGMLHDYDYERFPESRGARPGRCAGHAPARLAGGARARRGVAQRRHGGDTGLGRWSARSTRWTSWWDS